MTPRIECVLCVLTHRRAYPPVSKMITPDSHHLNQEVLVLSKPRPRVLCVDDDEDSRVMLVTLLKHALIEAKAVGTAAQALSLIQAEHFDMYMLDGWLPEIDGFELCRRMRAFAPHIPILFFSGAAFQSDKEKGIAAGADDYVIKPNIYELMGRVKQFISPVTESPVVGVVPWSEVLAPGVAMANEGL
jgi:CheY-like chemotaxis protein